MNRLIQFYIACCFSLVAFAASPSFQNFNTRQFDVTGNRVAITNGAAITNLVLYGSATNLLEVYNSNNDLKFWIDTDGYSYPQALNATNSVLIVTNVTVENNITIKGATKTFDLVVTNSFISYSNTYVSNIFATTQFITNSLTVYSNTYVSNIYAFTGVVSNNLTVLGNSALNTVTAQTINATNSITVNGVPVATFAGITNVMTWALSDMTTALTTGTNKNYWYAPAAGMTVKWVRATVAQKSTSGTPTFDINEAGTSILSTKITIDQDEFDSLEAATAPVISDSAIAAKAKIDFDIDVAGTAAAGAQIQIGFTVP